MSNQRGHVGSDPTNATQPWVALLDGVDAEDAVAVVKEIAAALTSPETFAEVRSSGASPADGKGGVALFFAAIGEALEDRAAMAVADELLDLAIDEISNADQMETGLYGGTLGLAWTLSRLQGVLVEPDDSVSDADELVARVLTADPWPGQYDLVQGLVGLGVFCIERLPRPIARQSLETVVAHLGRMAEAAPEGLRWRTTPAMFPHRAAQYPDGHYDVGLAHGAAGVVALLAAAVDVGVTDAAPLLDGAIAWIRSERLVPTAKYGFSPGTIGPDGVRVPARMAWCYGDPGVAVALLAAGHALDDPRLIGEATELATACAPWVDRSGVVDASICHGSAGLGHIFNRLGQTLGDERLLDLARYWFGRTLRERRVDMPVAGFPFYGFPHEAGGTPQWEPQVGILEGAAGVGLALLAAATPVAPRWDSLLLIGPLSGAR